MLRSPLASAAIDRQHQVVLRHELGVLGLARELLKRFKAVGQRLVIRILNLVGGFITQRLRLLMRPIEQLDYGLGDRPQPRLRARVFAPIFQRVDVAINTGSCAVRGSPRS